MPPSPPPPFSGQSNRLSPSGPKVPAGGIGGNVGFVDDGVPRADGVGGQTLQGSTLVIDDAGVASGITFADPTLAQQPATKHYVDSLPVSGIGGTVGLTDNAVPRANGTGGTTLQGGPLVVDDAGLASGITFANPSTNQQPATKVYTDTAAAAAVVTAEAYTDTQVATKIGGSVGATDNVVTRSSGTGGKTIDASAMVIDDTGLASGITFADPSTAQQPATKAYVDAHAGIGGTVGVVDNAVPRANGTGGATLQGGPLVVDDAGLASGITFANPSTNQQPATKVYTDTAAAAAVTTAEAYTDTQVATKIGGNVGATDNVVPRSLGTGGKTIEASTLVIDDTGLASGITFADPSTAQQPATKNYVGNAIAAATIASSQIASTYGPVPFTRAIGAAALIQTVPIADNTIARITVYAFCRDTGNNWFKQKSSTDWTRAAAGAALELLGEDGPVKGGTIGGVAPGDVVGITYTPGATSLDIGFTGSPTIATAGQVEIDVKYYAQAHA
jgi:hypothetical protein